MAIVIQPGLSAQAIINHVPNGPLDGAWFRDFCIKFLIHADARNAVAGAGTSISGNVGQPATIGTTGIPVTALAPIPNDTVIGNVAGITAVPTALTQTQLTTLVNQFSTGLSGAVPASGGGTTNFLRADGTFAAPPGGTTSPLTTKGDIWGYDTGNNRIPVGSDGTLLSAASSQALGVQWAGPVGIASKVTTFLIGGGSPQTFTPQAGSKVARAILIAGGGGGGSGLANANAGIAGGGGGGGGGGVSVTDFDPTAIGGSATITFSNTSTGGNGGAGVVATSGTSTNGSNGTNGSDVTLKNNAGATILLAKGGAGGSGPVGTGAGAGGTDGTTSSSAGGGKDNCGVSGANGGSNSIGTSGTAASTTCLNATNYAPPGGGGGGGCAITNGAINGGAGGAQAGFSVVAGGTAGIGVTGSAGPGGAGGNGQSSSAGFLTPGTGGGGGGNCGNATSAIAGVGGQGGAGIAYGTGGGGGGGCNRSATGSCTSGAGGQGGPPVCIIIEW